MLKAGVTNQAQLEVLLARWMMLNHIRWAILTVMWCITLYYFVAKGRLLDVIEPPNSQRSAS